MGEVVSWVNSPTISGAVNPHPFFGLTTPVSKQHMQFSVAKQELEQPKIWTFRFSERDICRKCKGLKTGFGPNCFGSALYQLLISLHIELHSTGGAGGDAGLGCSKAAASYVVGVSDSPP